MHAPEYNFRTKTGRCTITASQILLTREGFRGNLAKLIAGNSIYRPMVIYGICGILLLGTAFMSFVEGNTNMGIFDIMLAVILLRGIISSRNNSASPVIERSTIQMVVAHPPRPPFIRGYFSVLFNDNGKLKKRLIMLPGCMQGGSDAYNRGKEVLTQAGLSV